MGVVSNIKRGGIGDTIFYTQDYFQGWHPPTFNQLGSLVEENGQILLQTDTGSLSLLEMMLSTPECNVIGYEHPRANDAPFIKMAFPYTKYYNLQLENWNEVDKVDFAVDMFGLVGDAAFNFPPAGTAVWVASEIPEFLTAGKPWTNSRWEIHLVF